MRSLGPGPEIASQPVPSVSPRLTRDHQPRRVAWNAVQAGLLRHLLLHGLLQDHDTEEARHWKGLRPAEFVAGAGFEPATSGL